MKYILDNSGYVESASCNPISCDDKVSQEYKGSIPSGYSSLDEWILNANIRAYKITSGNLVYDSARDAELTAKWEQTDGYTQALGKASKNLYPGGLTQMVYAPCIKLSKGTYTITEIGSTSGNWYFKAYKNGNVLNSGVSFNIAFSYSSGSSCWYRADTTLQGFTFTLSEECIVQIGRLNATGAQKVQLELGSTASKYEEYYSPVIAVADSNGAIHEAGENYSLGEQKIGTWIDGKPLYRKVVTYSTKITSGTVQIPHGIGNLDTVVKCDYIAKWDGKNYPAPIIYSEYSKQVIVNFVGNGYIYVKSFGETWDAYTLTVILEYTKTTD
jgi:hypothetical protein